MSADQLPAILFTGFLAIAVIGAWGLIIWDVFVRGPQERAKRAAERDVAEAAHKLAVQGTRGRQEAHP